MKLKQTKLKLNRSYIMAAAIVLCLIMAACASNGAAITGAFSDKDLGIEISGKTYYLREDSSALIEALGSDYEYSEMVSCVYDGKDKTFTYDGISVGTVPVDGEDVIEVITLTSDKYTTLRGAKVGDSTDSVKELYGEGWFDDGYLTYSISGDETDIHSERIQFEYTGDTVTRIFIYSPSY
jgi:hypothetical protein